MAEIVITIRDTPDGKVNIVSRPPAEDLMAAIRQKDGRGVPPSKIYAVRAITAMLKLGREPHGIITRLPKIDRG